MTSCHSQKTPHWNGKKKLSIRWNTLSPRESTQGAMDGSVVTAAWVPDESWHINTSVPLPFSGSLKHVNTCFLEHLCRTKFQSPHCNNWFENQPLLAFFCHISYCSSPQSVLSPVASPSDWCVHLNPCLRTQICSWGAQTETSEIFIVFLLIWVDIFHRPNFP